MVLINGIFCGISSFILGMFCLCCAWVFEIKSQKVCFSIIGSVLFSMCIVSVLSIWY